MIPCSVSYSESAYLILQYVWIITQICYSSYHLTADCADI